MQESHELAALKRRNRVRATEVENRFDSLGEEARLFHLELTEVIAAIGDKK